jgi:hypothetical protein
MLKRRWALVAEGLHERLHIRVLRGDAVRHGRRDAHNLLQHLEVRVVPVSARAHLARVHAEGRGEIHPLSSVYLFLVMLDWKRKTDKSKKNKGSWGEGGEGIRDIHKWKTSKPKKYKRKSKTRVYGNRK